MMLPHTLQGVESLIMIVVQADIMLPNIRPKTKKMLISQMVDKTDALICFPSLPWRFAIDEGSFP